jgi:Mor family transcriptional regulator
MIYRRNAVRNREVFAACQNGETVECVAKKYWLSPITVHEIIRIEKLKLAVSVDAFYRDLRSHGGASKC